MRLSTQGNIFKKDIIKIYNLILTELNDRFKNMSEIVEDYGFLSVYSLVNNSMCTHL